MQKKQIKAKKNGFYVQLGNDRAQAVIMNLAPGDSEGDPKNKHKGADQWMLILKGRGLGLINGKKVPLKEGLLLLIEKGDVHEIRNTGRSSLRTLNFYAPPAYSEKGNPLERGKRR